MVRLWDVREEVKSGVVVDKEALGVTTLTADNVGVPALDRGRRRLAS